MLDFLKDYWRKRMLRQMMNEPRSKKIANIDDIKQIGIIFRVADEYDWNVIYHFIKVMEGMKKEVRVIGLQDADTELSYIITHSHTIICHEKEDLTFWGLPKDEKAADFVGRHYDVLIDTNEQPDTFGQYLTLRCDADLRVARIDTTDDSSVESGSIYDLMINSEGPLDMKDYFNNIVSTLTAVQK